MDALTLFVLTKLASTEGFFVFAALMALFLFLRKEWHRGRLFIITTLGLAASTALLKILIAAPRPEGAQIPVDSYAFPSGHASGIMFLALSACIMAYRLPRLWRYATYLAAIALTVTIGTSRIYYDVHTPLQVFAGFVLGAVWALVWYVLSRRR